MNISRTFRICFLLLLAVGCKFKNSSKVENSFERKSSSDPFPFEEQFFKPANLSFERQLGKLPLAGAVTEAWSDTYLPNLWAGAAFRWFGDNNLGDMTDPKPRPDMWNYKLYSSAELQQISQAQLKSLSPAEKYDILLSRYDYPLTSAERKRNLPTDANWEGVCNGWSTASLKYSEPPAVTIINREGIAVPFASSDIKSLLMLHQYLVPAFPHYAILGSRCSSKSHAEAIALRNPQALSGDSLDACSDSNAGAFHLVVTNMIGRLKKGLVFDVDRDEEVWNQPVFKYESAILEKSLLSAKVRTYIWYSEEEMPAWDPFIPAGKNGVVKATYTYNLELDPLGNITGGSWIEGSDRDGKITRANHPDFVWYGDGEQANYFVDKVKGKSGDYTPATPIDMGGVIGLWEVAVGKSESFRGLKKFRSKL